MHRHILSFLLILFLSVLAANAQMSRLTKGVNYGVDMSGTASGGCGDFAPFWLTANRYGLSSVEKNSGYLRAAIGRNLETDSLRQWRIGYGVDIAAPINYTSNLVIQQLYADVQYKALRLSVGSKERKAVLKNTALSSGGLTYSGNARPIPQVRFELPDFWAIPGTKNWLAIKGHVAYGMFTDENWQTDFISSPQKKHTSGTLYHSKAGFLRVGNAENFPLTLTAGLEMYAQFGGEAWNVDKRLDDPNFDASYISMGSGLGSFWNAFIPGGSDASDGNFANSEGNQLGSWHLQLHWQGRGWGVKAYAEHYFEDHSQMFMEYGWKDMLWGVEAELPHNPFVSTVLYEYLHTTDQTGAIYHDATPGLNLQISGRDDYYNHSIFGGWQHWGQTMGNPLLLSPIYNKDGSISFAHNRITAHHMGISGTPLPCLDYRALFSYIRSLGTYPNPLLNPEHGNSFMLEVNYTPKNFHGISLSAAFATSGGSLYGNSTGGMLTLRKTGVF